MASGSVPRQPGPFFAAHEYILRGCAAASMYLGARTQAAQLPPSALFSNNIYHGGKFHRVERFIGGGNDIVWHGGGGGGGAFPRSFGGSPGGYFCSLAVSSATLEGLAAARSSCSPGSCAACRATGQRHGCINKTTSCGTRLAFEQHGSSSWQHWRALLGVWGVGLWPRLRAREDARCAPPQG